MGTRIAALVLITMFFLSTIGFSIYVIWETNRSDDPEPVTASNTTNVIDQANNQADTNNQNQDNLNANDANGGDVLQGTILTGFDPRSDRVTALEIIDTVEGDGAVVQAGDTVTVHYTGALVSDGTIFQSSKDLGDPITFGLDGLIEGWQEGIPGMKVGGTRRLVIPAAQAYGEAGSPPSIPGDADLVFDIELSAIAE